MCTLQNAMPSGCSASPGAREPDMGCPALVQQGECWPNIAPCGTTENEMLASVQNLGVAFSQNAWAAAQQEGCLGCPDRYPKWPAKKTYQRLDTPSQFVVGEDPDFAIDETPFLQHNALPFKPPVPDKECTTREFIPHWPQGAPTVPESAAAAVPAHAAAAVPEAAAPAMPVAAAPSMLNSIGNSCRGIAYDLSNWNNLDPDMGTAEKMHHVFLRDNRPMQLLYLAGIALVVAILLYAILQGSSGDDGVFYKKLV